MASEPALPEAAGRRLGSGAWSSGLSVPDFASCLSMGMDPVGFVQGYAVMQWTWYANSYYGAMGGPPSPSGAGQYSESWQCPHGFVGGDHRMYGYNYEQTWVEGNWSNGWTLAYQRMVDEAASIGAHGIIGVVDDMQHLSGTGAAEFKIRGTAVTVPGADPPPRPFTTFLAGQKLVKLVEAGFVPVSVVASLASVQMVGYCITHYQMAGTTAGNWSGTMSGGIGGVHSITQVGKAQRAARHLARERVRQQLGSDILHGASLEQFDHEVGEGDLAIQCLIKGTRVRTFKDFDPLPVPDAVVRLS
ncbi:MAG: heavy metal-binding domain-containing protein [Acidimicrobiales bacterium]